MEAGSWAPSSGRTTHGRAGSTVSRSIRYRRRAIAARLVLRCELVLRKKGLEMFAALIEPENQASEAFFESQGYDILPIIYARKKRRESV